MNVAERMGRLGTESAFEVLARARAEGLVMLGRVDELARHPIRKLYDAGVIVTVNTDDVLVFGNGVSEEFLGLYQARVLTADELFSLRASRALDCFASLAMTPWAPRRPRE